MKKAKIAQKHTTHCTPLLINSFLYLNNYVYSSRCRQRSSDDENRFMSYGRYQQRSNRHQHHQPNSPHSFNHIHHSHAHLSSHGHSSLKKVKIYSINFVIVVMLLSLFKSLYNYIKMYMRDI